MNSLSYCHLLNEVKETTVYKDLEGMKVVGLAPVRSVATPSCRSTGNWDYRKMDEEVASSDHFISGLLAEMPHFIEVGVDFESDRTLTVQTANRPQSTWLSLQHRQRCIKLTIERLWRNPVQALSNVVVAWNPSNPNQRWHTAGAIVALSHSPLMRQKRRRLLEECRKHRDGDVAEPILRVLAATQVCQLFEALAHFDDQSIHHRIHARKCH